ncbi:MAG: DUF6175 family protein [Prevotella sp.]
MKKYLFLILSMVICLPAIAQTSATVQPKIMVVPYVKEGKDIKQIIENNSNIRIVLSKIREAFDNRGFTTVDFEAKLKTVNRNNALGGDTQSDLRSMIIQQSGADIWIEAEIIIDESSSGNSVKTILKGNDISTGASLANQTGFSGKFYTNDFGRLAQKAIENIADNFLNILQTKFTDIVENGRSIIVDFKFDAASSLTMSSEIGSEGLALSDQLELWVSDNAYKNNYHIQGTTDKEMIFDEVRIPLKDENGNNYNINKFGLKLFKHLRSLNLQISRNIANNTLVVTFK